MKCGGTHIPGECPLRDEQTREFKCADCDKTGHPATYKSCLFMKFMKEQKKEQTKARNKLNDKKLEH